MVPCLIMWTLTKETVPPSTCQTLIIKPKACNNMYKWENLENKFCIQNCDADQSQTFLGSKLDHLLIFFQEVPISSICVIQLTNKRTNRQTIRKMIPDYIIHITLSNLFDYQLIFVTLSYRIYHSLVAVAFFCLQKRVRVSATLLAN